MDGMTKCIVCGEKLNGFYHSHKCDPKVLKAKDAADKRRQDSALREPSMYERLAMGFFIQSLGES